VKITGVILLCLLFTHVVTAQQTEEYIENRIDSAWHTLQMQGNSSRALEIAEELLDISENQDAYLAYVTAHQVIAEVLYHNHKSDSALVHYKKALQPAKQKGDQREQAYILQSIAMTYDRLGHFDSALAFHNKSLTLWTELRDTSEMMFAMFKKGILYDDADQHYLSLQENFAALKLAELTNDSANMVNAFVGMGIVHKKQENYDLAKRYYQKAIEFCELLHDELGKARAKVNLALIYKSEGDHQKAHDTFVELYQYFESIESDFGMVPCLVNQTVCSNRLGKYERALDEGTAAIQLARKVNHKEAEADAANEMGIANLALGRLNEALKWSTTSRAVANEIHSLEKKRDAEKTLSDIYMQMTDYQNALLHFQKHIALKDTIFEERKSNQILELQTKYEAEQQQLKIENLEALASHQRFERNAFLLGMIGVILFSLLIINREIKRRKKARSLHVAERELALANKARLEDKLIYQNRELTAQALHIAQKHQMIQDLKTEIENSDSASHGKENSSSIIRKIEFDARLDDQWDQFMQTFTESNPDFLPALIESYPELSKTDLRICALIRMNLSNKDMANVLNISDEGVKKARYRLRKKLNLENTDNLETTILKMA